jgi:hypothetical protein
MDYTSCAGVACPKGFNRYRKTHFLTFWKPTGIYPHLGEMSVWKPFSLYMEQAEKCPQQQTGMPSAVTNTFDVHG